VHLVGFIIKKLKQHVSAFKDHFQVFIYRSQYILQCQWQCNIYWLSLLLLYLLDLWV